MSHLTATADNRSRTGEIRYLRTSFTTSFRTTGRNPVMIFIGNHARPDLIQTVTKHYSSDSARRWKRLLKEPRWGIADCLYLFADWTSILDTLRDKLREAELRSSGNRLPVAVRTRLLHQQTATVVEVRESLRFYQAVIVHTRDKQNGRIGEDLSDQLRQMKRQLDHNMITLDTLKDQLSNLINLEFNLTTVAQSRSVAGLTVLALIYIPLSYVASFFAIPDLNANPKLYPAAALPLLVLTLAAAWVTNRVMQREAGQTIPMHGRCPRLMAGAIRLSSQLRQSRKFPDIEGGTLPAPAPAPAPAPLSPSQSPPAEGKRKEEHESKSGYTSPVPSLALFSFPPSIAVLSEEGKKKVAPAQRMYIGCLSDMEFRRSSGCYYYSNLFCYV
ncbi:uncharacterized protein P174DRAFT_127072 [Aspergillus novofumigatus IBT 16806]|uniref:Uncharacterized protein n=1 Tax=Aspergillus novofumigatus (strain IBT 16806) TaxID=1392255 RepID=A0A2I1CC20_ASPN1|nr:uncharacterized protein P174DRAFT_127072 [Aspergillus novofumigatus IBT 16806]PKX95172.1 hypothetical protein P174DRAFT_127072 [Aspergillus novofumigatus IBT 16806]